jgi:glycosyltransferase involved in cell wall biosynthesis
VTGARIAYVLGTAEGGTGRHVGMLARGVAAAGLDVGVFGPPGSAAVPGTGSRATGEGPAVGVATVAIGDRLNPARDAATVRRLRWLLTDMAPDVVHAHGMRAGALAALALRSDSDAGGPPAFVVTVHNAPPAGAAAAAVYGLLGRIVARTADTVLCVSQDLEVRMRRLGAREVGRAVVAAADREAGAAARPPDLGADGAPVVLAAGRLALQKGFDTLIAAAGRWRDRRPKPLLIIAGTGPAAAGLAHQARGLGVSVRFLGWRDDVAALLAAADVFVLPSQWEGRPLILAEALRAGRPIVATDVGGVRDLTGPDAALLVAPGDPDALAAAVLSVLDDRELAERLGSAAARRAAALPTETDAIKAVLELYERLRP